MYSKTSHDVRIIVVPSYLPDQSRPDANHYVWAYHVRIENRRSGPVRLRRRYWHITDALGQVTEVEGPGVVGQEPLLQPGEHFEYTSGTPLKTPSGIMKGYYSMDGEAGERLEIEIPAFSLDSPHERPTLN